MEPADEIQRKALRFFVKYGLKSVNMDDLAHHLSISKKTLYQQYGSKEELILRLLEITSVEWNQQVRKIQHSHQNPIHKLIDFTLLRYEFIIALNPAFLLQSGKQYGRILKTFNGVRKEIKEVTSTLLEEAYDQQLIHQDIDIKIFQEAHEILFEYFVDGYNLNNPQSFKIFKYLLFPPLAGVVNQHKVDVWGEMKRKISETVKF